MDVDSPEQVKEEECLCGLSSFVYHACGFCPYSQERRKEFEANLEKAGLQLETEDKSVRVNHRAQSPPSGQFAEAHHSREKTWHRHREHGKSQQVILLKLTLFVSTPVCALFQESKDQKTYFLKIHAPWDVLATYAEVLNIRFPFKENDIPHRSDVPLDVISHPFRLPHHIMNPEPDYFTYPFDKSKTDFFLISDRDTFFPPSTRNRIVSVSPRYSDHAAF